MSDEHRSDGTILSAAEVDILDERRRQIEDEGFKAEHDDWHGKGELALAAGAYCESAARPRLLARKEGAAFAIPKLWPLSWDLKWWKPTDKRRDLVKAGALIIAEIERLDRIAEQNKGGAASKIETGDDQPRSPGGIVMPSADVLGEDPEGRN
ncbi:hypothetical protein [Rhizobium sp. PAMB 3182]